MTLLTAERLWQVCGQSVDKVRTRQAEQACQELGHLAKWWLRREVLSLVRDPVLAAFAPRELPHLSNQLGSCWIICQLTKRRSAGLLRPAMLLPLRWQPHSSDSRTLPRQLRDLAEVARQQVAQMTYLGPQRQESWSLHLDPALGNGLELGDDLFESVDSGWAAVTAGLMIAVMGLHPRTDVFASVAWDDRSGPERVEGLEDKVRVAREWGARAFVISVTQRDREEVFRGPEELLKVCLLKSSAPPNAWESLRDCLVEFADQPSPPRLGDEVGFEQCRRYHALLPHGSTEAQNFYRSHLQGTILHRLQERTRVTRERIRPALFVTICSKSPELAVLTAKTVAAQRTLLLHTPDLIQQARLCQTELGEQVCQLVEIQADVDFCPRLRKLIAAAGVEPARVVLDLKPGTKKMTFWMSRTAQPGNWLFNLETEFASGRPIPGTERPEFWQADWNSVSPEPHQNRTPSGSNTV